MFTIQIVGPMDSGSFDFEDEEDFNRAINLLKNDCHGQSIKEAPDFFCFRAYSYTALKTMKEHYAENK